jgi:hypothetical protein
MSSTVDPSASTLNVLASTVSGNAGSAQQLVGISLSTFLASLSISVLVFGIELSVFLTIKNELPHI